MDSPIDIGNSLAQVESGLFPSSHTFYLDQGSVRPLVAQPTLVAKEDTLGIESAVCVCVRVQQSTVG